MNDRFDLLESELAALEPRPVSPGVRDRIAAELDPVGPASPGSGLQVQAISGRSGWLVLTACIVAAGLLFVFVRWPLWRNSPEVKSPAPNPLPQVTVNDKPSSSPDQALGTKPADQNLPAFTWPLYETPPLKGYASIPADLLD